MWRHAADVPPHKHPHSAILKHKGPRVLQSFTFENKSSLLIVSPNKNREAAGMDLKPPNVRCEPFYSLSAAFVSWPKVAERIVHYPPHRISSATDHCGGVTVTGLLYLLDIVIFFKVKSKLLWLTMRINHENLPEHLCVRDRLQVYCDLVCQRWVRFTAFEAFDYFVVTEGNQCFQNLIFV